MVDRLLTMDEVAQLLRTNRQTMRYWRATGKGPKGIRVGKRVLYREADIQAFISAAAAEADRGVQA